MLILHADNTITRGPYTDSDTASEQCRTFNTWNDLDTIIHDAPGERAVAIWNNLPGVTPITTKKFRNRSTAVERIWNKLAELFPGELPVIVPDDPPMPQTKAKTQTKSKAVAPKAVKGGWAADLAFELRKRFQPGDAFTLEDVYKLIPAFQRRHKDNHHVAARLRTTLARELRGKGIVKAISRGKYKMVAG